MTSDNLERVALKSCPNPWCAGEEGVSLSRHVLGRWHVCCDDCMIEGPWADTDARAIEAWNTRASAIPVPSPMGEERAREILLEHGCPTAERLIRAIQAAVAEERARADRRWYATLRSAQHALDIIARGTSDDIARPLAKEESERIEQALEAIRKGVA